MAQPDYLLRLLDTEWQQLTADHAGRRRLVEWQTSHPELLGLRTLGELLEAIDKSPLDKSSRMVWALLELADSDALAKRAMLQVIVPGLAGEARWVMSWARRVEPGLIGGGDVDQMIVAVGLDSIAHATGARRAWPIKSILRHAHRLLRRETLAREALRCELAHPGELVVDVEVPETAPGQALVDLLNHGRRQSIVTDRDVALLWLIGIEGYTAAELAGEFGSTPRAVAQRRWRAEGRLAAMVAS